MDDTESVVRNLYAALARGDVPAAVALMSPRVEWLEAEHTPYYAGLVVGPDKVVETVFEPVNKHFENFALTEQTYITQGGRTAAIGVYRGRQRQTGRELSAPLGARDLSIDRCSRKPLGNRASRGQGSATRGPQQPGQTLLCSDRPEQASCRLRGWQ
jgi:ketosteroid isomerase-like protein